jgi:hypothetical protein
MTTIKLPSTLRDRINVDAQAAGLSVAGLVERLLDSYDRQRRMTAFGRAFRSADADYWDEFTAWDVTMADADA